MRYCYRPAYYQSYVERFEKFCVGDLLLDTLDNVIGDTIITTKHERCDQPHQLFCFPRQRAIIVSLGIKVEEAFDLEVSFFQNLLVHFLPVRFELLQGMAVVRHFWAHRQTGLAPGIRMW